MFYKKEVLTTIISGSYNKKFRYNFVVLRMLKILLS